MALSDQCVDAVKQVKTCNRFQKPLLDCYAHLSETITETKPMNQNETYQEIKRKSINVVGN